MTKSVQPQADLKVANLFINRITGETSAEVCFQVFPDRKGASGFPWHRHGTLKAMAGDLTRAQKAGCGVYVVINKTDGEGRSAENVEEWRAAFVDFDGVPLPEEWPLEPHIIVESSPGRFHAYWLVEPSTDLAKFTELQARLAAYYSGDPKVIDPPRVMRLPGFRHLKGRPFLSCTLKLCTLEEAQNERYIFEQIEEAHPCEFTVPQLRDKTTRVVEPEHGFDNNADVERAIDYLRSEAPPAIEKQGGDLQTFKVACRCRDFGLSEAMTLEQMAEHYNPRCDPPWDESEDAEPRDSLAAKVRSAYRSASGDAGADSLMDFQDERDVPPDPPKTIFKPSPMEWIEPAKIPRREWIYMPGYIGGYVSLTTAAGGGGKSSLVRAECAAIASGKALLGIEPKRTPTWYWNGEDPKEELVRGFAAIRLYYNLQKSDLVDWLFFDSGRDMPIKLAAMRHGDFKIAVPVVAALIEAMKANRIGVMAVDPFVTTHEVNENDNMMMNSVVDQWRKVADETGAAIHLVHHTRKTNGELANIEASRGASAVSSAARVRRAINTMTQAQAKKAGVTEADRLRYISADYRSTSFIPATAALVWYKFESANLGNGDCGDGESIGVITAADVTFSVRADDEEAALEAVRAGGRARWRRAVQAGDDWIGVPIAKALGLNHEDRNHRAILSEQIKVWLANGVLEEIEGQRANRTACKFIVAGPPNSEEMDFG